MTESETREPEAPHTTYGDLMLRQFTRRHTGDLAGAPTVGGRAGREAKVLSAGVQWEWVDGGWQPVGRIVLGLADLKRDGTLGQVYERPAFDWAAIPALVELVRAARPQITISVSVTQDGPTDPPARKIRDGAGS